MENYVLWDLGPVDREAFATRFELQKLATRAELRLKARGLSPVIAIEVVAVRKKLNSITVEIAVDYRISLQRSGRTASGRITLVQEARILEVAVRDALADLPDVILSRVAFSHGAPA